MLKPMPPINPYITYRNDKLVACDEMANAADAMNEPIMVTGRKPHRFAIALTNGPAIK